MSECGLLQPRPSPRGRELHSLHQEQHQLSTLQGHQVRGKSRQRHRRPLEATTCHLCHPALTLTSFWGRSSASPCMWGGCLQLQGLWEERLWGLGGRGSRTPRQGGYPSSWHAAAFLPAQAQPGGGGGCPLHEDLPLSQNPAPSVPSLQAWLRGTGIRPEFQHLGREGIVPGVWGGLDPRSPGLIF